MINFFYELNPILQSLIASIFAFSLTTLGASFVFFIRKPSKMMFDITMGASAGIMLSSAIFSLLIPSINEANALKLNTTFVISLSILLGTLLLILGDLISNKFILKDKNKYKKILLLCIAISIHNIPEGASIGVAIGSVPYNIDGITILSALSLTLAIGIQNIPEGAAISIPLYKSGLSKIKSFLVGTLTGLLEVIASVIGTILVLKVRIILPILLSFASGAMFFIIISELIPDAMNNKHKNLISFITLSFFVFMMILEIITN